MVIAPPASAIAHSEPGARWRVSPGWIPAALVTLFAVGTLLVFEVSVQDLAVFAAYLALGIVLPGTLLWRALRGRSGWLVEDVAAGAVLGYALETLLYIGARSVDAPLLVLIWPVATIVAFASVPGLRHHWRPEASGVRVPVWWAWAISGFIAFLVFWAARTFFTRHGLTWPGYAAPYVDMPYHLALLGELRHHVPPTVPTVLGEALSYHWFVYAEMASTSWVTGIEAQTLLYRLSILPMLALMVVLVAAVTRRMAGGWLPSIIALGITYLMFCPELVTDVTLFNSGSMLNWWTSPTQTFGGLIFAAAALLLVDCLRENLTGRGSWVALAVLLLAVAGAKATFLPLIVVGLFLVIVVTALVGRRLHRPAFMALGLTATCLLIAQVVIFRGGGQGMVIAPLATMRRSWGLTSDITGHALASAPVWPIAGLTALHLLTLACLWGGLFGLVRTDTLRKAPVIFMVGMGVAAIGVVTLLGHPGLAQLYFLQAARPYLAIAAVCGLVALRPGRWTWCSAAAGAGLALLVRAVAEPRLPVDALLPLAVPYLILVAFAGAIALTIILLRKPVGPALVALALGFALPASYARISQPITATTLRDDRAVRAGALAAGRWLREHSSPDDVVATNVHCRSATARTCDSRTFWVSAYSERRMLVEGWAYTEKNLAQSELFIRSHVGLPFWDQQRLRDNDVAFRNPSVANVTRLREKYGVRWLFVDDRHSSPSPLLGGFAKLRFSQASCSIYELA